MEHTPGPWYIEGRCRYGVPIFASDGIACIGVAYEELLPDYTGKSNALLMAAAPELLNVCKMMLARLDLEPPDAVFPGSALRDNIRAAIAKAEGEQCEQ